MVGSIRPLAAVVMLLLALGWFRQTKANPIPLPLVASGARIDNVADYPQYVVLWIPDFLLNSGVLKEPDPAVGYRDFDRIPATPWAIPRALYDSAWAATVGSSEGNSDAFSTLYDFLKAEPRVLRSGVKTPAVKFDQSDRRFDHPCESIQDVYHITRLDSEAFKLMPVEAVYSYRDGHRKTLRYPMPMFWPKGDVNAVERPVPMDLWTSLESKPGSVWLVYPGLSAASLFAFGILIIYRKRRRA